MSTNCDNVIKVTSYRQQQSTIFQCSYKWVVSDFRPEGSSAMQTSQFSIKGIDPEEWYFRVEKYNLMGFTFRMALRRVNYKRSLFSNMQYSILDSNHSKMRTVCSGIEQLATNSTSWLDLISVNRLLENPDLYSNDTLTILCNFQLVTINSEQLYPARTTNTLIQDMKCLLESRNNADVILQASNETLKAHKAILAARSPVFAAMFENDMVESKENKVNIPDVPHDVLKELLVFMYTNETPNLKTTAVGLLRAAEKYNVESLKLKSEQYLLENTTVENAAEIVETADLYNAKRLKKNVVEFIHFHRKSFVMTTGYKALRQSNPELVFDIFEENTLL